MTEPNERPIIFNSEMVKAILDGRKTQTRRIVKPQPCMWVDRGSHISFNSQADIYYKFPYGQPGDRLWVRETWLAEQNQAGQANKVFLYKADADDVQLQAVKSLYRWRPSIHMPRWASRITLEITNVRVERLQDITEEGAIKEGVPKDEGERFVCHPDAISKFYSESYKTGDARSLLAGHITPPKMYFSWVWDKINGSGAWGKNPWVWVIEFRRIKP